MRGQSIRSVALRRRLALVRAAAYAGGDYAAGALTALATAAAVHAVVETGLDMVLAMFIGATIGTVVHLTAMALLGPFLGMFQVMVPGASIGMYGGMLFGMRDAMQSTSWTDALEVGFVLGLAVVAAVRLYDRALQRAESPGGAPP